MRKYLNTLYITSPDAYMSLDGECIVIETEEYKKKLPLINLEAIVSFSYKGASPRLMGKCAQLGIQFSFFTPSGRYLANTVDYSTGNIHLRYHQYEIFSNPEDSLKMCKSIISAKLYNSTHNLKRCVRDHKLQVDTEEIIKAVETIRKHIISIDNCTDIDSVRGIEGNSAEVYFSVFNEMILHNKTVFCYTGRTRRPPMDNINALLSFAYSLLAGDCASALYSVGLDPFLGFMHTKRPGRKSLALDMEEEFRPAIADRFVLYLINNRVLDEKAFIKRENGAVYLTDSARKIFLTEWQKHKNEIITHPFLKEKAEWGLMPYLQAMLMSRYLRGDLDAYPPFFYR